MHKHEYRAYIKTFHKLKLKNQQKTHLNDGRNACPFLNKPNVSNFMLIHNFNVEMHQQKCSYIQHINHVYEFDKLNQIKWTMIVDKPFHI